ncbi:MAG: hypothetical protein PHS92_02240 [Candidatus Gracilibacteria bacterium]|nr:hypothetical protein [Candidatus Gracilibacteria bacterium]
MALELKQNDGLLSRIEKILGRTASEEGGRNLGVVGDVGKRLDYVFQNPSRNVESKNGTSQLSDKNKEIIVSFLRREKGTEDIIDKIMKTGVINIQDKYGRTALMHACYNGSSALVSYILCLKDVTNNKTSNGLSAEDFARRGIGTDYSKKQMCASLNKKFSENN